MLNNKFLRYVFFFVYIAFTRIFIWMSTVRFSIELHV
jgi:hypothetical protein